MKRDKVYKGLMGVFGASLALAGCSSSQKPAALGPAAGSVTGSTATSPAPSSATGAASSSAASSSSSASSAATSSSQAPTSVSTSQGGWSYSASVPADTSISGALTAFQNYAAISYEMAVKVEHNNDLVKYADGNVLSLANNFVTQERQDSIAQQGPEIIKVLSATLDPNAKPAVVTVTACTDDTKLPMIITYGPKKGQISAPAPKTPYPNIYKVHMSADGKWRVHDVTPESDKTC